MKKKTKPDVPAATGAEPVPPGATRDAFRRPENDEHGPGESAGPRHAAADRGSVDEEYGAVDSNNPLAEPPIDEEPDRPPYADISGHPTEGAPIRESAPARPASAPRTPRRKKK